MKDKARVVIIGGGIVGASTAYHLTRLGWGDVVVLDMGPLFKNLGSTSHAPGLMFQHNNSRSVCHLAMWSVQTYLEAEQEADLGRTVFQTGSLEIAHTRERWQELKRKIGNTRSWCLEAHLIGPDEVKKLVPIMHTGDLYGAFYVPSDCDVRGVKVLESLAKMAQARGAEFYPQTRALNVEVKNGRAVAVDTSQGRIEGEHIVCAAGLWGPIVGRMAGLNLPMTPCQHLYMRTGPLNELAGETEEVRHPVVRYQDKDMYFRQHGEAYGFGTYRHDPLIVFPEELPDDDHPAIFPFTPEHARESRVDAIHRFPCLKDAPIVDQFNGLFSFTPDGNSIFGQSPGARNFIVAEAVWITHGGGVGRAVANLLVHGDPGLDLRELDLNRFHPHAASKSYIRSRAERQYIEVYDIIHPLQQMENPRGLRTSPFHARLKELGAMFFESAGWERPMWFGANERLLHSGPHAWPSRSGWAARYWSPIIGAEHMAVRERAGLFDLSNFFKIEVTGPGAAVFLQQMTANNVDTAVGRIVYTSMLTEQGGIKCDLSVTRLGPDHYWVLTGGGTGPMDLAWLQLHVPADGLVHIANISSAWTAIGVWGPLARDLVQSASHGDWSNATFPYLTVRDIFISHVPVRALRISYAGELGWELYTPTEYGLYLWDVLWEAGAAKRIGAAAAGGGAFDSLRLEKGYRLWGSDIHTEYNPYEAGLGFAVRLNKGDFIGRGALERIKAQGVKRKLCCMVFDDPGVAVMGKEPIFPVGAVRRRSSERSEENESPLPDTAIGYVTSANFGYSVRKSIAYGYLPVEYAQDGTSVEVYYFGDRFTATVTREPLYDPENAKLKA